ncbi:MAG TPA: hypothetical protein VNV16_00405 [Methylibium sp.]|nr:hypothetical protein [Methylibium sp.]
MNSPASGSPLRRALRAIPLALLRAVVALFGLAFMLGVLLFGLAAGTLLIAWALLRGRRPALRFGGMRPGMMRRAAWPRPARADVIEVEAREIDPRTPG